MRERRNKGSGGMDVCMFAFDELLYVLYLIVTILGDSGLRRRLQIETSTGWMNKN